MAHCIHAKSSGPKEPRSDALQTCTLLHRTRPLGPSDANHMADSNAEVQGCSTYMLMRSVHCPQLTLFQAAKGGLRDVKHTSLFAALHLLICQKLCQQSTNTPQDTFATHSSQGEDDRSHGAPQVHLPVHPRPVELHDLDHNGVL